MGKKSRWLAMLCIASLFIAVGGCSDDDDDIIPKQEVSADQAESLIEDAVPFILEFGTDIADLIELIYLDKSGGWNKQATCDPIPGVDTEFFCTNSADGQVCTENEVNSELVFDTCTETGPDPGMLDGTVTVIASTFSFDLLFALDVDDGSMNGNVVVALGDPCVTLSYTNFVIEEGGVSNTLNGSNTICPESASGTISVTVNATGIQRFLMEISFNEGIPTILIISPTTQMPLYTCTYNPLSQTAQCFPYDEF